MKPFTFRFNEAGDSGEGNGGGSPAGNAGASGGSLLASGEAGAALAQGSQAQGSQGSQNAGAGAFDFRSLIGDDGKFVPGWTDKLPDEFQEHKAHYAKYGDINQVLRHPLSLQQLLGKKADAVVIPGPDGTKEEWAPVLKRLGVPDTPEGYGLKIPDKLPDGVKINPEGLKKIAQLFHDAGLNPKQAAMMHQAYIDEAGLTTAQSMERAQAIEAEEFGKQKELLTKLWGNGPEAIKKQALAERTALTFGFTSEEIQSDPIFRNARVVDFMAKAGAAMSEDTLVKGTDLNSAGGLKARASDVINNPQNPLYAKYWAGDEETNNQVRNWMKAG